MAFYAEIYGYIACKDCFEIPLEVVDEASKRSALFSPCFSLPIASKNAYYISFAASVKLDVGEEDEWLSGFEFVLSKNDFIHSVVNILHEESGATMMYSYVKDINIQKFSSKLIEQFIQETIIDCI